MVNSKRVRVGTRAKEPEGGGFISCSWSTWRCVCVHMFVEHLCVSLTESVYTLSLCDTDGRTGRGQGDGAGVDEVWASMLQLATTALSPLFVSFSAKRFCPSRRQGCRAETAAGNWTWPGMSQEGRGINGVPNLGYALF